MFRLAALSLVLSSVSLAAPKNDWFASLYTGEGVELRNEERVFALFAIFNAAGFDQGPVTRKDPVPRVAYHPVRQLVRSRVIGGDPDVKRAADAFFDAHPTALRRYLSYAVASEPPPFSAGAKAKDLQELKGLEAVLAKAWTAWKLEEVLNTVQAEYRQTLKSYLSVTDFPLQRARTLLKTPESQEVLIVVNLLDANDEVRAVSGEAGEVFIIAGPSDKPNVKGVIREFTRLAIEASVAKAVTKWGGGVAVLKEAQLAGAPEATLQEYAAGAISEAVALRATEANDAAFDAAHARGYFGIKDISRLFDDGKNLDSIVTDALQKLETRRPAKK